MNSVSGKSRWFRIGFYFAVLIGLICYGRFFNPNVTLQMCLQHPDQYDGIELVVGDDAQVAEVFDGWFTIRQRGRIVKVVGSHKDLQPREYVIFRGIFHREGWMDCTAIYVATMRRFKIYISIIPVIIVMIIFFLSFRFDLRSLQFHERR